MGRSGRSRGGSGGRSSSSGGGGRSSSGGMRSSTRSGRSSGLSSSSRASSSFSSRSSSPLRPKRVRSSYGGGFNVFNVGNRYSTPTRGYSGGSYAPRRRNTLVNIIITIIMIMVLVSVIMAINSNSSSEFRTVKKREPLPMSMSTETDYYTDTLGWINNSNVIEKGMIEFYKSTGVQPHLYIVNNIEGNPSPNNDVAINWGNKIYDELFQDEAHMLLIFLDNGQDYGAWIIGGSQTKTVIDSEAQEIIHNYVDKYYYSSLDDDEMFSKVFSESAESIMTVYKSPWIKVALVVIGVVVLIIILKFINKRKEQQLKENEQTIEILNTPLEKIDIKDEADDLANKYK